MRWIRMTFSSAFIWSTSSFTNGSLLASFAIDIVSVCFIAAHFFWAGHGCGEEVEVPVESDSFTCWVGSVTSDATAWVAETNNLVSSTRSSLRNATSTALAATPSPHLNFNLLLNEFHSLLNEFHSFGPSIRHDEPHHFVAALPKQILFEGIPCSQTKLHPKSSSLLLWGCCCPDAFFE